MSSQKMCAAQKLKMGEVKKNNCLKCKKSFQNVSNLKRHVKKFHPDEINELAPGTYKNPSLYKYTCNFCQKNFNLKVSFNYHIKQHIPRSDKSKESLKCFRKCPLCNYECHLTKTILSHFISVHDITINSEEYTFSSFKEFEDWKVKFEEDTVSKFSLRRAKLKTAHYLCHRSGYYVPRGTGKKHLKTQGSCRINSYCPASIVVFNNNDIIRVKLIRTHIGHENEIGHFPLTPSERKMLASKIASKIPYDEILNEVRDTVSDETLKRIHLLNRQDLYNVARSFNLKSVAVQQNDAMSEEAWINKMQEEGDTILFYKAQGITLHTHPELKREDFVLIIMTPAQQKFLEKYGTDCICLDGTHGMNSCDFEMTTVMVLDDMKDGFPAAFLISNRCDKDVMSIFFSNIQLKVGVIKTSVFMSDLADSYFEAWVEVMDLPQRRLFCSWHLLQDWRKNLSKIKGKENQELMHEELRVLLEERDQDTFEIMIGNFCTSNDNPDFEDFKNYFKDNYFHNRQYWAYCYRLNCGINTNMHLERMHGLLKYIYLKGEKVKRLDKAINAIMRIVRDKLINRLIVSNKGKISKKVEEIRQRHKAINDLDMSLIVTVEHGWEILSRSRNEVYFIQEYVKKCSCKLVCTECATCIHRYRCSCLDSSIKFNMCKHSHLIAQFRQITEENNEESFEAANYDSVLEANELDIVTKLDLPNNESDIVKEVRQKTCSKTIDEQKNDVRKQIDKLLQGITEREELETLNKLLAPISPMMAALKGERNSTDCSQQTEPPNKKICTQKRIISTKKTKDYSKKIHKTPPIYKDRMTVKLY